MTTSDNGPLVIKYCTLTFSPNGQVLEIRMRNGLQLARFGIRGPFRRNAEKTAKGYEEPFQAEVRGIADYQHIDSLGNTVNSRGYE